MTTVLNADSLVGSMMAEKVTCPISGDARAGEKSGRVEDGRDQPGYVKGR